MTPLDDHSQRRRPIFFPVVIATVLLTIIGMIGGYLLSERQNRHPSVDGSTSATPGSSAESAPSLLPTFGRCPEQTQTMAASNGARGELSWVFKATTTRKRVVWICQDEVGQLFYHANKGGEQATWVEGQTALFLTGVRREPDGSFSATAPQDGTVFSVNSERVLITYLSGKQEEQKVVPN